MSLRKYLRVPSKLFFNLRLLCLSSAIFVLCLINYQISKSKKIQHEKLPASSKDYVGISPEIKCVHPKLDPKHPSLVKFFFNIPKLQCAKEDNWVFVNNGTFQISEKMSKLHGSITCDITPLVRATDFKTDTGAVAYDVKNGTKLMSDFFSTKCKAGNKYYTNVHAGISFQKDVSQRVEHLPMKSLGLNILTVGFDSISRMTAIRKLPKSRDYFHNVLKGFDLEDYNIIGDGTPAALLPILTGQREEELPEARRGHKTAEPVDRFPFIWKDFKKAGYVTAYAEDQPSIGTYHYRMLGFKNQPTDHYMRNFYIAADKTTSNYCYGSVPKHKYFLDWIRDAFITYPNKRKFVFGFHCELSHADSNKLDYIDEDVVEFFKFMETNGYLNNTLLIYMSDHGSRFSANRQAVQGKQEERLPMFSIRFPPWFENKYPEIYKTLKINAHRLTTPYDIHETMKDILNFSGTGKGDISKRGISLFKEIPKERTCDNAGVEAHWCACLDWKPILNSDPILAKLRDTIKATLNEITSAHREHCVELSVKQVFNAVRMETKSKVLKFLKAADTDGRVGDFSANTVDSEVFYQVTLSTQPGDGRFEVTVRHTLSSNKLSFTEKDVSRINQYGSDPDCVAKDYPNLRRFCYCKNRPV